MKGLERNNFLFVFRMFFKALALSVVAAADPCHGTHAGKTECLADAQCTWCDASAVPSACYTKEDVGAPDESQETRSYLIYVLFIFIDISFITYLYLFITYNCFTSYLLPREPGHRTPACLAQAHPFA